MKRRILLSIFLAALDATPLHAAETSEKFLFFPSLLNTSTCKPVLSSAYYPKGYADREFTFLVPDDTLGR